MTSIVVVAVYTEVDNIVSRLRDVHSIGVLGSESNRYCFEIEDTWLADRHGLEVTEVAIAVTDRTAGASRKSGAIAAGALPRVLRRRPITAPTPTIGHPGERSGQGRRDVAA